jgi:hypothetical protein
MGQVRDARISQARNPKPILNLIAGQNETANLLPDYVKT